MSSLTAESAGYISLIVIAELYWVLNHSVKASRENIRRTFETLLFSAELVIEKSELVMDALQKYQNGSADFDDYLIASCALRAGCGEIVTFDRKASRMADLRLLK